MEDRPVRVAFCKILFWKYGGSFDPSGLPRKQWTGDQRRQFVRGKCSSPYDCGQCSFLQEWLTHLQQQGWGWGWECDKCLRETEDIDRSNNTDRHVQGFYQAGRKGDRTPDDPDYDPDRPGLEGCTRCAWESSFLQLVIRRPKHG
jgi:hypothetical protein